MRLIDLDSVERIIEREMESGTETISLMALRSWLNDRPTISPDSLVKRGRWILNNDGSGTCDQCRRTQIAVWDFDNVQKYCGHCGALMED